jgi:hypothetical protein
VTNFIPVEVTVAGATGLGFVDTGDPVTELSPQTFPSAPSVAGGVVPQITIGSTTVSNVQAFGSSQGLISVDPAYPFTANLGYTSLSGKVATFNYRDVTFSLGSSVPGAPSGLLSESVIDFTLQGGVVAPASRIMVTVSIEGTDYLMMLDAGATLSTVSQSVFSQITSDGRKVINGGSSTTTQGSSSSSISRVASMALGGASVTDVVIAHNSGFDTIIDGIAKDIGHPYAGSLGGTFLNQFYVTIDYPSGRLHLAPYADSSFVLDPAHVVGLGIGARPSGGGYPVAGVLPGSDAASKGVSAGDIVVAIDGQSLASATYSEATVLLYGAVGTTKSVEFAAAKKVANQTLTLSVMELLPLTAMTFDGGMTDSPGGG